MVFPPLTAIRFSFKKNRNNAQSINIHPIFNPFMWWYFHQMVQVFERTMGKLIVIMQLKFQSTLEVNMQVYSFYLSG